MPWSWTDYRDEEDEAADRAAADIDGLARTLAAAAGRDWDLMNQHPGFERNSWRDAARRCGGIVAERV